MAVPVVKPINQSVAMRVITWYGLDMAIDIRTIDDQVKRHQDQIRRLQEIKRMASDPEMLTLLEGLVTKNGSIASEAPKQTAPKFGGRKDVLSEAVMLAIAALPQNRFTAAYLVDRMLKAGFQFVAGNPHFAVTGALRRLAAKGKIRVAMHGSGRRATEYERMLSATETSGDQKQQQSRSKDGGRVQQVAQFLREHGSAKRSVIQKETGIPLGTVCSVLNDKSRFKRLEDGRWDNVGA
jgi:hypothetical protein